MTVIVVPNDSTFSAPTNNPSTALEATGRTIKAAGGVLYGMNVYNSGAAAFVQLFDTAAGALPVDGAVPVDVFPIGSGAALPIDYGMHGKSFGAGISACISSTAATKTVIASVGFFAPRFK
jgi:hypothetical protein